MNRISGLKFTGCGLRFQVFAAALLAFALTARGENMQTGDDREKRTIEVPAWVKNFKVSGYGMIQYQGEDKEGGHHNEFNLRLMRLILDGKTGNWDWRVQVQGTNVRGPGEPTVQLVDLYTEWVKYKALRIKAGQFKRAFTFENPTHPVTQGWYSYAMAINSFAGFGDRTGEKSSAGRDIGLQVQGDVLPNASGRSLLHYQVGVYNGEGINQKDKDNRKDIIGGLWVMPVNGVRIGAFGWTGSRAGVGEKNRYALSAEYDKDEYTFRAEYIHSQGMGAVAALGDKADGWYVFGIVPVIKSKLHAKARYQCYRQAKCWNGYDDGNGTFVGGAKTMYEVGANYFFTKNLQLNLEYARVNDRTIVNPDKHNYNLVDLQLDFRF